MSDNSVSTPGCGPVRVRKNKSATLYLRVLEARGGSGCGCKCAACLGDVVFGPRVTYGSRLNEPAWIWFGTASRDRRYGFVKRYGLRTTVSTRRFDRVDSIRRLY